MEYQYQLSNGMWTDAGEKLERLIDNALKTEEWLAPRQNRQPMTTREDVIAAMDSGKTITIGSDWYDKIRAKPTPLPPVQVEMVKCSCGHTVPRTSVMNASLGTSCPECYDRMSA